MKSFIGILTKLNLISVSYADSIENTPVVLAKTTSVQTSGILSIILSILTFIAIATVFTFLFIIIRKRNIQQIEANKSISVLDRINLDHNSSLFVVEIQNKLYILGKTDNSINKVAEISNEDDIKLLKLDCLNKQEITFQSVLSEQINSSVHSVNNLKNSNTSKAFRIQKKKEL